MKRISALTLITCLLFSLNTKAQIGNFLKEKAKKAVVKGLKNNESEQTQNEQEQTDQNSNKKPRKSPTNSIMQQKMMGLMGFKNVKFDPVYNFTSNMKTYFESKDSASTEINKGAYTFYFDKNSKNFAMELEGVNDETNQQEKALFIFDYKNNVMLVLNDKDVEKSGFAIEIQPDSTEIEAEQINEESYNNDEIDNINMYYKPTGKTKNILGYTCKEYVYQTPEGISEIWATNDIKYNYKDAFGQMNGMQLMASGGLAYTLGTILEMHFKDADSDARADFWVKEFNQNEAKTLSVTDYQVIGMGESNSK
ncbi:DUF4412 domain-containing protein [Tenuifilum thalassicum]|uniref:DUF4412 domain-containing protein n=1 Tax=Tenuifilum thalassicum TaxID=2590900 RepID=A0A7D4BIT6_9BACT|nr:DUF4412 domain-containing protein [Tenuifilum thalassicum]QKG79019.1 DUF4412 domain-containing protein [Tenuifilum thalassicum]